MLNQIVADAVIPVLHLQHALLMEQPQLLVHHAILQLLQ